MPLSTNVVVIENPRRRGLIDMLHYSNPGLDAELAYRREQAMLAGRGTRRSGDAPRHRLFRRHR